MSCCALELPVHEIPPALTSIPQANPFTSRRYVDLSAWRNPYVIVSKDRVEIFDRTNHSRRTEKSNDLLRALAHLPRSAWPEGKVVAIALEYDVVTASAAELRLITAACDAVSKDLSSASIAVAIVPVW